MDIYIRPLVREDALISYSWRNNPEIWELTGSKPDIVVTPEIELKWIDNVIKRNDQKRFAICIAETNEYIGNVQLTNIKNKKAEFHIFIGETSFWGKGIGKLATKLMTEYGFTILCLSEIYLWVNELNAKAIRIYQRQGFSFVGHTHKMILMSKKNIDKNLF